MQLPTASPNGEGGIPAETKSLHSLAALLAKSNPRAAFNPSGLAGFSVPKSSRTGFVQLGKSREMQKRKDRELVKEALWRDFDDLWVDQFGNESDRMFKNNEQEQEDSNDEASEREKFLKDSLDHKQAAPPPPVRIEEAKELDEQLMNALKEVAPEGADKADMEEQYARLMKKLEEQPEKEVEDVLDDVLETTKRPTDLEGGKFDKEEMRINAQLESVRRELATKKDELPWWVKNRNTFNKVLVLLTLLGFTNALQAWIVGYYGFDGGEEWQIPASFVWSAVFGALRWYNRDQAQA